MEKRLKTFWNTIRVIWRMFPLVARILIVLFALACLTILILSPDRQLWLILCGVLFVGSVGAGVVIYRLIFPKNK